MKPKMRCDGCQQTLKFLDYGENTLYVVDDKIGGLSVMKHLNTPKHVVLCEECFDDYRNQLMNDEQWLDLDLLDNAPNIYKEFFQDYSMLKLYVEGLNNERKS